MSLRIRITTLFLILVSSYSAWSQTTVHVSDVSGSDALTCGSAGSPCLTIQYAVDSIAVDGDTIQIDTGEYALPSATNQHQPVVKIPQGKSLAFLGTVSGLGTRINGDSTRRGFLYYYAGTGCNSGSANDGIADTLDFYFRDLVVEDCMVEEMCGSTSYAYGGGMRLDCDSNSRMTVNVLNCTFRHNQSYDVPSTFAGGRSSSGGAIFIYGRRNSGTNPAQYAEAHIKDCEFNTNVAIQQSNGGHGGAVLLRDLDTASVTNSSFCDNYVYSGGADNGDLQHDRNAGGALCFYDIWNSTPAHGYHVDSCTFINNSATTAGGSNFTFQSEGGAIFFTKGDNLSGQSTATLHVSYSEFYANTIEPGVEHLDNNGGTLDTSNIGFNAYYSSFDVLLGPDTTLCEGDTYLLDVTMPGGTYFWQDSSTAPTFEVTEPGTYAVTVSVGSCFNVDTVEIDFQAYPVLDLGDDTTLCPYDSFLIDVSQTGATYMWQDSSTSATQYISGEQTFWVVVEIGQCAISDSLVTDTVVISTNTLGNDTLLCPGAFLVLDASTPFATYEWQNYSTSPTFTVTQEGQYYVEIEAEGCMVRDTIDVDYVEDVIDILGEDQFSCEGDSVLLVVAQTGLNSIQWSTGETTSSIWAHQSGTYSVTIDKQGCDFTDQVDVTFKPLPVVDLGDSLSACDGDKIVLDATYPNATYTWQNQSHDSTYTVTKSGFYQVTVTLNGCSVIDHLIATYYPIPVVNLGPDQSICEDKSVILNASQPRASYTWSTGQIDSAIVIQNPGVYSVGITIDGCTGYDTMNLEVVPIPIFDLGADTAFCEYETPVLSSGIEDAVYEWHDLSTRATFEVEKTGEISLTVTKNGCLYRDTIWMEKRYLPEFRVLNDTVICNDDSLHFSFADSTSTYLWNDVRTSHEFVTSDTGLVTLLASNHCGVFTDTLYLSKRECECRVYVPNAFTPDADQLNDLFGIEYICDMYSFEFVLRDRWGHEVYSTKDPLFRWNGKRANGLRHPQGVYVWEMRYDAQLRENGSRVHNERIGKLLLFY